MAAEQKGLSFLQGDPLRYIDLLEPLRRGMAQVLYAGADGVQLQVGHTVLQASVSGHAAIRLLQRFSEPPTAFVAHSAEERDAFAALFGGWDAFGQKAGTCNPCRLAAYFGKTPLAVSAAFSIRRLTPEYLPAIQGQYHLADDPAYLQERMQSGVFYGAFIGGKLAGFIGEHAEGAMGMLEVYPEFRRKGVASALEAHAVNRSLAAGRVPFCDVICGNEASFALQQSLGLAVCPKEHYWMVTEDSAN